MAARAIAPDLLMLLLWTGLLMFLRLPSTVPALIASPQIARGNVAASLMRRDRLHPLASC